MAMSDKEYWELLKQERMGAQERVAQFNKNNPMTGNAFKDMDLRYATKTDRKKIKEIDGMLQQQIANNLTSRGQDIHRELGLGEIDVNKERNRLTGRGQDFEKEIEMRKADVTAQGYQQHYDVGMAEVGLNRDVFDMTKQRYEEFGRKGDELALMRSAATTKSAFEDFGFEPGSAFDKMSPEYIGVPKPNPTEQFIPQYNNVPMPKAPAAIIAESMGKGPSAVAMPYAGMSIGRMAGEKIGKGIISLFEPPIQNKVRRKVKK